MFSLNSGLRILYERRVGNCRSPKPSIALEIKLTAPKTPGIISRHKLRMVRLHT